MFPVFACVLAAKYDILPASATQLCISTPNPTFFMSPFRGLWPHIWFILFLNFEKKNWYHLDRSSNNFWTFSWDFYTITVSSSFPNHTLPLPPQSDQFTTYSKQVKLCFAYRYFLRIDPYTQKNSINVYSIGVSQTIQISKITKFILASLDKYGRCWHFLNTDIFLKNYYVMTLCFFFPLNAIYV